MAAYYVVSEMLTNAAKHAQASTVYVDVERAEGVLHISVRDDGVGGADPARGSGLVGLRDRVEALGGTIDFQSAKGAGTAVEVLLPLDRTAGASEQDLATGGAPGSSLLPAHRTLGFGLAGGPDGRQRCR